MNTSEIYNQGGVLTLNPRYNPKSKKNKEPKFIIDPAGTNNASAGLASNFYNANITGFDMIENPQQYQHYGAAPNRITQDINKELAARQSAWSKFGNAFAQTLVSEIGLGTALGFTDLFDGIYNVIMQPNGGNDYQSEASKYLESLQREFEENVAPIYRDTSLNIANGGLLDAGWWASNIPSIASSLTLMIPSMAVGKAITTLGRITKLNRLARKTGNTAAKLLKKGELALNGKSKSAEEVAKLVENASFNPTTITKANVMFESGISGLTSRVLENYQESRQTYNDVRDEALQRLNSMSQEQYNQIAEDNKALTGGNATQDKTELANAIAKAAADETFKIDMNNAIFDVYQMYSLRNMFTKGVKRSVSSTAKSNAERQATRYVGQTGEELAQSVAKESFKLKAKDFVKNSFTGGSRTLLAELSEGVEEAVNYVAQQEGMHYGKYLLGDRDNTAFDERMSDYWNSPQLWESAFWGVFGGVAFHIGGNVFNRGHLAYERAKNKKNLPKEEQDKSIFSDLYDNDTKVAIDNIHATSARTAELHRQFEMIADGKDPWHKDKDGNPVQLSDSEKDERRRTAKEMYLNSVIIDAINSGNKDFIRDYLQDENVRKYMIDKGIINEKDAQSWTNYVVKKLDAIEDEYAREFTFLDNLASGIRKSKYNSVEDVKNSNDFNDWLRRNYSKDKVAAIQNYLHGENGSKKDKTLAKQALAEYEKQSKINKDIPVEYLMIIATNNVKRRLGADEYTRWSNEELASARAKLKDLQDRGALDKNVDYDALLKQYAFTERLTQMLYRESYLQDKLAKGKYDLGTKIALEDIQKEIKQLAKEYQLDINTSAGIARWYNAITNAVAGANINKKGSFNDLHNLDLIDKDGDVETLSQKAITALTQRFFGTSVDVNNLSIDDVKTQIQSLANDFKMLFNEDITDGKNIFTRDETKGMAENFVNGYAYQYIANAERQKSNLSREELESKLIFMSDNFDNARTKVIRQSIKDISELAVKYDNADMNKALADAYTHKMTFDENDEFFKFIKDAEDRRKFVDALKVLRKASTNEGLRAYANALSVAIKQAKDEAQQKVTSEAANNGSQSTQKAKLTNSSTPQNDANTAKVNGRQTQLSEPQTQTEERQSQSQMVFTKDSDTGNITMSRLLLNGQRSSVDENEVAANITDLGNDTYELEWNAKLGDPTSANNARFFGRDESIYPGVPTNEDYVIVENPIVDIQGKVIKKGILLNKADAQIYNNGQTVTAPRKEVTSIDTPSPLAARATYEERKANKDMRPATGDEIMPSDAMFDEAFDNEADKQTAREAVGVLNKLQDKVVKHESDDPYYGVDENGIVEDYQRVHTCIGDSYIGDSSASNSARYGTEAEAIIDAILMTGVAPEYNAENFNVISKEVYDRIVKDAIDFRQAHKGEVFIANNLVLFGNYGGNRVAGEIDVIGIKIVDGKAIYTIYDVKSIAEGLTFDAKNDNAIRTRKEQYARQLTLYKHLAETTLGIKISDIKIIPVRKRNSNDSITNRIETEISLKDYIKDNDIDKKVLRAIAELNETVVAADNIIKLFGSAFEKRKNAIIGILRDRNEGGVDNRIKALYKNVAHKDISLEISVAMDDIINDYHDKCKKINSDTVVNSDGRVPTKPVNPNEQGVVEKPKSVSDPTSIDDADAIRNSQADAISNAVAAYNFMNLFKFNTFDELLQANLFPTEFGKWLNDNPNFTANQLVEFIADYLVETKGFNKTDVVEQLKTFSLKELFNGFDSMGYKLSAADMLSKYRIALASIINTKLSSIADSNARKQFSTLIDKLVLPVLQEFEKKHKDKVRRLTINGRDKLYIAFEDFYNYCVSTNVSMEDAVELYDTIKNSVIRMRATKAAAFPYMFTDSINFRKGLFLNTIIDTDTSAEAVQRNQVLGLTNKINLAWALNVDDNGEQIFDDNERRANVERKLAIIDKFVPGVTQLYMEIDPNTNSKRFYVKDKGKKVVIGSMAKIMYYNVGTAEHIGTVRNGWYSIFTDINDANSNVQKKFLIELLNGAYGDEMLDIVLQAAYKIPTLIGDSYEETNNLQQQELAKLYKRFYDIAESKGLINYATKDDDIRASIINGKIIDGRLGIGTTAYEHQKEVLLGIVNLFKYTEIPYSFVENNKKGVCTLLQSTLDDWFEKVRQNDIMTKELATIEDRHKVIIERVSPGAIDMADGKAFTNPSETLSNKDQNEPVFGYIPAHGNSSVIMTTTGEVIPVSALPVDNEYQPGYVGLLFKDKSGRWYTLNTFGNSNGDVSKKCINSIISSFEAFAKLTKRKDITERNKAVSAILDIIESTCRQSGRDTKHKLFGNRVQYNITKPKNNKNGILHISRYNNNQAEDHFSIDLNSGFITIYENGNTYKAVDMNSNENQGKSNTDMMLDIVRRIFTETEASIDVIRGDNNGTCYVKDDKGNYSINFKEITIDDDGKCIVKAKKFGKSAKTLASLITKNDLFKTRLNTGHSKDGNYFKRNYDPNDANTLPRVIVRIIDDSPVTNTERKRAKEKEEKLKASQVQTLFTGDTTPHLTSINDLIDFLMPGVDNTDKATVLNILAEIGVTPDDISLNESRTDSYASELNNKVSLHKPWIDLANGNAAQKASAFRHFIHEHVHAKIEQLDDNTRTELFNGIEEVLDKFRKLYKQKSSYKFEDTNNSRELILEEFLVETLTRSELQKILNDIKDPDANNTVGKSLFQRILDVVTKLFGIKVKDGSLLQREANILAKIFDDNNNNTDNTNNDSTVNDTSNDTTSHNITTETSDDIRLKAEGSEETPPVGNVRRRRSVNRGGLTERLSIIPDTIVVQSISDYVNTLSQSAKQSVVDSINKGEIKVICSI